MRAAGKYTRILISKEMFNETKSVQNKLEVLLHYSPSCVCVSRLYISCNEGLGTNRHVSISLLQLRPDASHGLEQL